MVTEHKGVCAGACAGACAKTQQTHTKSRSNGAGPCLGVYSARIIDSWTQSDGDVTSRVAQFSTQTWFNLRKDQVTIPEMDFLQPHNIKKMSLKDELEIKRLGVHQPQDAVNQTAGKDNHRFNV